MVAHNEMDYFLTIKRKFSEHVEKISRSTWKWTMHFKPNGWQPFKIPVWLAMLILHFTSPYEGLVLNENHIIWFLGNMARKSFWGKWGCWGGEKFEWRYCTRSKWIYLGTLSNLLGCSQGWYHEPFMNSASNVCLRRALILCSLAYS